VTCCDKLGITSHHIPSVDTSRNKTSSKICGSLLRGRSPRIKKGKKLSDETIFEETLMDPLGSYGSASGEDPL
jgi:hypothetical protein